MNIIIAGAAGNVGGRIVSEALSRGHNVTGAVRTEQQFGELPPGVKAILTDMSDTRQVADAARGQDLLISAVRPPEGLETEFAALTRSLLAGAADAGVRIILVGGAARLRLPDRDETVLSAPAFLPESAVAIARACQTQYELCIADTAADWTYVSPPALLEPGERTGRYRLGGDTLIVDDRGASSISMEDFAVALLDEAETPHHRRKAFTVAY